ncbi:MAG: c-type cytochrome biogenesis protein CcsB [Erysipelotrichaceae bacterium]|nr:c-type cytochrome biogenesis protein CcsB [Erysipelotrichaceae bacterium]
MNLTTEIYLFYAAVALYCISAVCYILFFVMKNEKCCKGGELTLWLAFLIHTVALVARTMAAKRLPLTNQYEFATSFAWGIALVTLIFKRKFNFKALGAVVCPVLVVLIGYAAMQSKEINELMPALQSNWLSIHVGCAIISYGSFGVAFGVAFLYLIREHLKDRSFVDKYLPDSELLDLIGYRAIALGFIFLTLVMITGAIWAERAWGHYWSWDPKETWSLITWFIYAIYLHVRISKGWQGKKAAWFALIGFICVIFTYIGVNTLIPSLHSYA